MVSLGDRRKVRGSRLTRSKKSMIKKIALVLGMAGMVVGCHHNDSNRQTWGSSGSSGEMQGNEGSSRSSSQGGTSDKSGSQSGTSSSSSSQETSTNTPP